MVLLEKAHEVDILAKVDVCVLGGGTTGVMAAVRAARMGAKVAIVETQGNFGGNATSSLVCIWHTLLDFDFKRQIIAGLTQEVLERLDKRHALWTRDIHREGCPSRMNRIGTYVFNPQELKFVCDEMLLEEGVTCCLHTRVCAPWIEDGKLKAVIVESKNGRQAILADFFIDATGDGELAYRAGVPFEERDGKQPSTTAAVVRGYDGVKDPKKVLLDHLDAFGLPAMGWDVEYPKAPEIQVLCKSNVFDNPLTMEGMTAAEIEGRRQIKGIVDCLNRYGGGEKDVVLLGLSSYIGIREGRSMKGLYTMTGEDLNNGVSYPDAIGYGSYPSDIHHADIPGCTFSYLNGMREYELDGYPHKITWWKEKSDDYPRYWQIPYRALVPMEYDNLLVCARALSADRAAFGAVRVMVHLNQTGEAAGVAAALCVSQGVGNKDLDTDLLRRKMAEGGSIIL